jgi:hypothetical protein
VYIVSGRLVFDILYTVHVLAVAHRIIVQETGSALQCTNVHVRYASRVHLYSHV